MRLIVSFAFVFSSVLAAAAQTPRSSPPPQPRPTPASTPQPTQVFVRPTQPMMNRIPNPFSLNPVSESDRLASRIVAVQRLVAPLYRKPSGKELAALVPGEAWLTRYADLLRQPKTGIFKLVPDSGCTNNLRVVDAREGCLKYSIPGSGNSYSFRTESYRIRHLADLTYDGEDVFLTGIFMHAIVTDLGDVPLEQISNEASGMKFLFDFKPSVTAHEVGLIDSAFLKGIEVKGYRYAKSVQAKVNSTYGFRGVAYRGKVVRSVQGLRYNEMDYDDREDVLVAFRIVDRAEDGSITIVWRQLSELEAPKIKIPETKDDGDTAGN